jgi:hypothetical protein
MLLAFAGPAGATVITQSNATWKVTPTDPGAVSWNTSAAFDDSAWQNATVLYDAGVVIPDPAYVGAKGIWSSSGQFSKEYQVWIRHTFSLGGPLTNALLTVGCDDDCTVWVNGTQVINDTNTFANNNFANVLPYLTAGTNLIALTVTDNYVQYGDNHSTWVQLDGTFASRAIPEPGTLALLATGVAGLGFYRRRNAR